VLGAHALLAEGRDDLAHMFVGQRGEEGIAGSFVLPHGGRAQLLTGPAQRTLQCRQFAGGDGMRQGWRKTLRVRLQDKAAIGQIERRDAIHSGANQRRDPATACRIETQPLQLQLNANAQAAQQRRKAAFEEVVRRRHRVVGCHR